MGHRTRSAFSVFLVGLAVSALLASCDADIDIHLEISDIMKAISGTHPSMRARAKVSAEIGSVEAKDGVLEILASYFRTIADPEVTEKDSSTRLVFGTDVPLVVVYGKDGAAGRTRPGELVEVHLLKDVKDIEGRIFLDREILERMNAQLGEAKYQPVGMGDLGFAVTLVNDMESARTLSLASVYVGGEPKPYEYRESLGAGGTLPIVASGVLRDSLNTSQEIRMFRLRAAGE